MKRKNKRPSWWRRPENHIWFSMATIILWFCILWGCVAIYIPAFAQVSGPRPRVFVDQVTIQSTSGDSVAGRHDTLYVDSAFVAAIAQDSALIFWAESENGDTSFFTASGGNSELGINDNLTLRDNLLKEVGSIQMSGSQIYIDFSSGAGTSQLYFHGTDAAITWNNSNDRFELTKGIYFTGADALENVGSITMNGAGTVDGIDVSKLDTTLGGYPIDTTAVGSSDEYEDGDVLKWILATSEWKPSADITAGETSDSTLYLVNAAGDINIVKWVGDSVFIFDSTSTDTFKIYNDGTSWVLDAGGGITVVDSIASLGYYSWISGSDTTQLPKDLIDSMISISGVFEAKVTDSPVFQHDDFDGTTIDTTAGGALQVGTIDSANITDSSVAEADLNIFNDASDEQSLTWEQSVGSSGGMIWQTVTGGGGTDIKVSEDEVQVDAALEFLDFGRRFNLTYSGGSTYVAPDFGFAGNGQISLDSEVTDILIDQFVSDAITIDSATLAGTVTIVDNESTDEGNAVMFVPGADLDGGNHTPESDGDFIYNPSSGTVTATAFAGDGSALTGVGVSSPSIISMSARNTGGPNPIPAFRAVYIVGASGGITLIGLADNTDATKREVLGITMESIAQNSNGLILLAGEFQIGATNMFDDGVALYFNDTGFFDSTPPTSGFVQHLASVSYSHGSNGKIVMSSHLEPYIAAASGEDVDIRLGATDGSTQATFENYVDLKIACIGDNGDFFHGDTTTGDVDVFSYFSVDGSWNTEYLKWDDGDAEFQLSDDIDMGDNDITDIDIFYADSGFIGVISLQDGSGDTAVLNVGTALPGRFNDGMMDAHFGDSTSGMVEIGNACIGMHFDTTYNSGVFDIDQVMIMQHNGTVTGNFEWLFIESANDIRFGIPKSGDGLGTYNARSMIIAGPAVFDDDIALGSYWGFDALQMITGDDGADLGVQNNLQVLDTIFFDSGAQRDTITAVDVGNFKTAYSWGDHPADLADTIKWNDHADSGFLPLGDTATYTAELEAKMDDSVTLENVFRYFHPDYFDTTGFNDSIGIAAATIGQDEIQTNGVGTLEIVASSVNSSKIINQTIVNIDIDTTSEDFVFNDAFHITSAEADSAYVTAKPVGDTANDVRSEIRDTVNVVVDVKVSDSTSDSTGNVAMADIGQSGATTGQVMKWSGSAWVADDDSAGEAVRQDQSFFGNLEVQGRFSVRNNKNDIGKYQMAILPQNFLDLKIPDIAIGESDDTMQLMHFDPVWISNLFGSEIGDMVYVENAAGILESAIVSIDTKRPAFGVGTPAPDAEVTYEDPSPYWSWYLDKGWGIPYLVAKRLDSVPYQIDSVTTANGDCHDDGSWSTADNELQLGDPFLTSVNETGLIFTSVYYKDTAQIDSVVMSVYCTETRSDNINMVIYGENVDSTVNYTTEGNWDTRLADTTDSRIDWDLTDNWTVDTRYTIDVTDVVKEVMGRSGWNYGNPIALMIFDDGTTSDLYQEIAARNTGVDEAARLFIYAENKVDTFFAPQPIYSASDLGMENSSDPCFFWYGAGSKQGDLGIAYRYKGGSPDTFFIAVAASSNGVEWPLGDSVVIIKTASGSGAFKMSPSIQYANELYRIYVVQSNDSIGYIERYTGPDLDSTWDNFGVLRSDVTLDTIIAFWGDTLNQPWHLDAGIWGDEYWLLINMDSVLAGGDNNSRDVWFFTSHDDMHYSSQPMPSLKYLGIQRGGVGFADDNIVYHTSGVNINDDRMALLVSAPQNSAKWHTGYTEMALLRDSVIIDFDKVYGLGGPRDSIFVSFPFLSGVDRWTFRDSTIGTDEKDTIDLTFTAEKECAIDRIYISYISSNADTYIDSIQMMIPSWDSAGTDTIFDTLLFSYLSLGDTLFDSVITTSFFYDADSTVESYTTDLTSTTKTMVRWDLAEPYLLRPGQECALRFNTHLDDPNRTIKVEVKARLWE